MTADAFIGNPDSTTTATELRAKTQPTSLYRYYDRNDILLYVGITGRGGARNIEHNKTKEWWRYVTRQEVQHFKTREIAKSVERDAIVRHRPPFNKQHNPDHVKMREAYLSLDAKGKLPSLRSAVVAQKYIPLDLLDYDGNRLLYVVPSEYAAWVAKLDRAVYGFACAGHNARVRITREDGYLWVAVYGEKMHVVKPQLRTKKSGHDGFTITAIDLLGDGTNSSRKRNRKRVRRTEAAQRETESAS